MECKPKAVCLDGNNRINRRKTFSLQTNFGEDSTGLHITTFSQDKKE